MKLARSRVTAQGQISVPAEIRKRLGIGPGGILEWEESNGEIVVKRGGTYSSEDIHRAVFGEGRVKPRSVEDMKEGIRRNVRTRRAGS